MRSLLAIAGALTVVACVPLATRQEFDRQMAEMIGKNINDVVVTLGSPLQTSEISNGIRRYTFALAPQSSRQPMPPSTRIGPVYHHGPGGEVTSNQCHVDFTVDATHQVIAYRATGAQCVARPTQTDADQGENLVWVHRVDPRWSTLVQTSPSRNVPPVDCRLSGNQPHHGS